MGTTGVGFFRTRYRIVVDRYNGFEAQYRRWWSPFWAQCFGTNTQISLQGAQQVVEAHKQAVVWSE